MNHLPRVEAASVLNYEGYEDFVTEIALPALTKAAAVDPHLWVRECAALAIKRLEAKSYWVKKH